MEIHRGNRELRYLSTKFPKLPIIIWISESNAFWDFPGDFPRRRHSFHYVEEKWSGFASFVVTIQVECMMKKKTSKATDENAMRTSKLILRTEIIVLKWDKIKRPSTCLLRTDSHLNYLVSAQKYFYKDQISCKYPKHFDLWTASRTSC